MNHDVRGILGMSLKWVDYARSTALTSAGGHAQWARLDPPAANSTWSGVSQGDGPNARDKKVIGVTSFQMNISLELEGKTFTAAQFVDTVMTHQVFFVIVLDRHPNGTYPLASEIFESIGSIEENRPRALAETPRFSVLKRKVFTVHRAAMELGSADNVHVPGHKVHYEFYRKFKKPLLQHYTGTSNIITNIEKTALHLFWMINTTGVSTTETDANISVTTRMRYSDDPEIMANGV